MSKICIGSYESHGVIVHIYEDQTYHSSNWPAHMYGKWKTTGEYMWVMTPFLVRWQSPGTNKFKKIVDEWVDKILLED